MAAYPDNADDQPQPFEATNLQSAKKRKRSRSPQSLATSTRQVEANPDNAKKRSASPPVRKQKRPGKRARIGEAEREQIRQRCLEREREAEAAAATAAASRSIHDAVREHYNAVPERGRDWRKINSRIKGLRNFNNWIKSVIIQKFSPNEDFNSCHRQRDTHIFSERPTATTGLLVLDIGCGKGGDLGKWQQAPQPVELYVGIDPADVSITQARERYRQMASRGRIGRGGRGYHNRPSQRLFHGEFYVQDCFGESIEKIPIVRKVGFGRSGGPSGFDGGGFDVVSMMFCMHYAFENETRARLMLRNVAGALKKGGRLIGCIPNSDVLSKQIKKFNARKALKKENSKNVSPPHSNNEDGEIEEGETEDTASWGNEIYKVRFPGKTPEDGTFRPPYGWKYSFFLHEAVEEVPEYVVPWEMFRAIAEDFNLEMQYHKPFNEIWEAEKNDELMGHLAERMGVRGHGRGPLLVSDEEMEVASFYVAFCFYKV